MTNSPAVTGFVVAAAATPATHPVHTGDHQCAEHEHCACCADAPSFMRRYSPNPQNEYDTPIS